MLVLRSLIFNVAFYGLTFVLNVVTVLTLPFPPRAARAIGRNWARASNFMLRWICGVKTEIRGRELVPSGPIVVASKHQSAWETFMFLPLLDYPVYVLKSELLKIPLFGRCLRHMGHIGIHRAAGASAIKDLVKQSDDALEKSRQVIIFPEGTRSAPGVRGRYHPGVAALYSRLDVTIQPVALNSGFCWGRKSFQKRPGTIVLEFLPPIPPGLDRREFQKQLEETIESACERLDAEAAS